MLTNNTASYWRQIQDAFEKEGQAVRWSVAIISIFLIWLLTLEPWGQEIEQNKKQLRLKTDELTQLQSLRLQAKKWKKTEQSFAEQLSDAPKGVMAAQTTVTAHAELQGALQKLIKQHNLQLERQQFLPTTGKESTNKNKLLGQKMLVQLKLHGAMADGYQFIYSLARARQIFILEKLQIGKKGTENINILIQVAGFMAPKGKSNDNI